MAKPTPSSGSLTWPDLAADQAVCLSRLQTPGFLGFSVYPGFQALRALQILSGD